MTGIVQDVTARKREQEALSQSQARLQMAVEAGQMGDWEWDIAHGKVHWSPGLEALHGLAPGMFGGTFDDFQRDMHPDDRERVLAAIARCLEERGDYRVEYRIQKPDGAVAWIEARGKLVVDADDQPQLMTGICDGHHVAQAGRGGAARRDARARDPQRDRRDAVAEARAAGRSCKRSPMPPRSSAARSSAPSSTT